MLWGTISTVLSHVVLAILGWIGGTQRHKLVADFIPSEPWSATSPYRSCKITTRAVQAGCGCCGGSSGNQGKLIFCRRRSREWRQARGLPSP